MNNMRDVIPVAERLLDRMGDRGPAEIAARAAAHQRAGDVEAALFWSRVGRAMKALLSDPKRPRARG